MATNCRLTLGAESDCQRGGNGDLCLSTRQQCNLPATSEFERGPVLHGKAAMADTSHAVLGLLTYRNYEIVNKCFKSVCGGGG